jgi:hypothetical protein
VLEQATPGTLNRLRQLSPRRAPTLHWRRGVDVGRLGCGEEAMARLEATQRFRASVKRKNDRPGIGVESDHPFRGFRLALLHRERLTHTSVERIEVRGI